MRMLGVPMVDRHPVKPCAKVARGLVHQFPSEATQAGKFTSIIRRDDEPKMMAVALATRDEGATVRIIPLSVE
ncbi:hypothetical protein ACVW0I_001359 [Bradyrhizobium sp. LM6.11]